MSQSTGSVYQRRDGRWVASLQADGRRKDVYAKSEREAKRKLAELQAQMAVAGSLPDPGRRTVDNLLDLWLETAAHTVRTGTLADYRALCARHIRPTLGHVKLSQLRPEHLQNHYNKLRAMGHKRTPRLVHALIHRALRFAVLWGWLVSNPADRVSVPRHQAERKPIWSPEELQTFVKGASDHRLYPLWLVAICSGCRLGELTALRWEDVDWKRSILTVRRSMRVVQGVWVEERPKTKAGERSVQLPAVGLEALRKQRSQQAEWRLKAGPEWEDKDLVFTDSLGRPLGRSVAEHALSRVCRRLGIQRVTPHGLRHLHASVLLDEGLPIPAVSARLGHSTPAITLSIYAHAIKREEERAAIVLQQVIGGNRP